MTNETKNLIIGTISERTIRMIRENVQDELEKFFEEQEHEVKSQMYNDVCVRIKQTL